MKKRLLAVAAITAVLGLAGQAHARNTVEHYPLSEALVSEPGKVTADIALSFGEQPHGAIVKSFGNVATNRKTNAFGKSDKAACEHVFLSAIIALQNRARELGGNAVVNIKSNYQNNLTSSNTDYVCGAGAVIAGVALTGDIVQVQK